MEHSSRNVAESASLEASLETAEVLIDLATNNEAVAAIPVVGTAIKIVKGIDDLRARAFAAKVRAFVIHPSLQTNEARAALRKQAVGPSEDAKKIGETLFLVLEQLNDMEKPALLAQAFAAQLAGVITSEELQRIAAAIAMGFIADLKRLRDAEYPALHEPALWKRSLLASGLTELRGAGPIGGKLIPDISLLGETFRKATRAVNPS